MKEKFIIPASLLGLLMLTYYDSFKSDPGGLFHALPTLLHGFDRSRYKKAPVERTQETPRSLDTSTRVMAQPGKEDSEDTPLGLESLIALFDGMGGYPAGEVASQLAAEVTRKVWEEKKINSLSQPEQVEAAFEEVWSLTQHYIAVVEMAYLLDDYTREQFTSTLTQQEKYFVQAYVPLITPDDGECLKKKRKHMGTTAVMAQLVGDKIMVAHSGDSRLAVIKEDGSAEYLTQDHINGLKELESIFKDPDLTQKILHLFNNTALLDDFRNGLDRLGEGLGNDAEMIIQFLRSISNYLTSEESDKKSRPTITQHEIPAGSVGLAALPDSIWKNLTLQQMQSTLTADLPEDASPVLRRIRVKRNLRSGVLVEKAWSTSQARTWRSEPDDLSQAVAVF
jgi:serine/threonine protein phosphatase PrpC